MYEHKINLKKEENRIWIGFTQLSKEYGGRLSQTWLMSSSILWDVMLCSLVEISRHSQ